MIVTVRLTTVYFLPFCVCVPPFCVCGRKGWAKTLVDLNYLIPFSTQENFIISGLVHFPPSFMLTYFWILSSVTIKIFPYSLILIFINLSSEVCTLKFSLILSFLIPCIFFPYLFMNLQYFIIIFYQSEFSFVWELNMFFFWFLFRLSCNAIQKEAASLWRLVVRQNWNNWNFLSM